MTDHTKADQEAAEKYALLKIPGFPGYKINIHGDVWSFKRKVPVKKAVTCDRDGYLRVGLMRPGKKNITNVGVHRLLLLAFKYKNGCHRLVADHINCVRSDNRLENLQWCTKSDNSRFTNERGRHRLGEEKPNSKLTESAVRFIRKNGGKGKLTFTDLAAQFGVTKDTVIHAYYGRTWKWLR